METMLTAEEFARISYAAYSGAIATAMFLAMLICIYVSELPDSEEGQ